MEDKLVNVPSKQGRIIAELSGSLVKLVGILRKEGPAKDFNWWNSADIFLPLYGYQEGKPLFDEVVQGVIRLNPEMLSEYEVRRRLKFDFLEPQVISVNKSNHLYGSSLADEAKGALTKLVEFQAWHDVLIPIANLWHEGDSIKVLDVTFLGFNKEEQEKWKKDLGVLWHEGMSSAYALASVRSSGDRNKAVSYALTQVETLLEVFRAFCFPFGRNSSTWRVAVVGGIIPYTSTPMGMDGEHFSSRLGPGTTVLNLKEHIVPRLKMAQWELVQKFFGKAGYNKIEMKLRDSIHWLAESTKQDTNNSKFLKVCVALECLLGGEPSDEDLKVRGITAMLAERAAFIAGTDLNDRLAIDKEIRKHYGIRSKIVHGGEGDVTLDDIDNFGGLVRRSALAFLEKLNEFGDKVDTVEKLENWVRINRYTLPK